MRVTAEALDCLELSREFHQRLVLVAIEDLDSISMILVTISGVSFIDSGLGALAKALCRHKFLKLLTCFVLYIRNFYHQFIYYSY